MRNTNLISEVTRIKEIMKIYSQTTLISEASIPRSTIVKFVREALTSFLQKEGDAVGRATINAISDADKQLMVKALKTIDPLADEAALLAKNSDELLEALSDAGAKMTQDGAKAMVKIVSQIPGLADEMAVKVSSDPEVIKLFDELSAGMMRNPSLYNKAYKRLSDDLGEEITKKIFANAKVKPSLASDAMESLQLATVKSIDDALRANAELFKKFKNLSKDQNFVDALYREADRLAQGGIPPSTEELYKIIDKLAPDAATAKSLKSNWVTILDKFTKDKFGDFSFKQTGKSLAGLYAIYLGIAAALIFPTFAATYAKKRRECLVEPHDIPKGSGNIVTFTPEEIALASKGVTEDGEPISAKGLPNAEKQKQFVEVFRFCQDRAETDVDADELLTWAKNIPFAAWFLKTKREFGKPSAVGDVDPSSGGVLIYGDTTSTDQNTGGGAATGELTGEQILEKFKEQYPGKGYYWGPEKWGGTGPDYWGYTDEEATEYVDYYYLYDKNTGKFEFDDPAVRRPKTTQNNQN